MKGSLWGFEGFDIQLATEVYMVVNNSIAASIFYLFAEKCLVSKYLSCYENVSRTFLSVHHYNAKNLSYFVTVGSGVYLQYRVYSFMWKCKLTINW